RIPSDPASFAAHVSLSSHIQLSKNRPYQTVTKSFPQSLNPGKQTSYQPIRLISLERKSSSPAAPPPSFSERTYKSTPPNKSTQQYQKNQEM
ncbi:hypothetical protein, partial [Agrobacterium tumefaciens]|uniref:hypothetical protein n=2 Tax=Agrobacterium tumefaciens TaxID=358 RepID=UPI001BA69B6B